MKVNWETIIPKKSDNHTNEWADYMEICCLMKRDIVSGDDILDVILDSYLVEQDLDKHDELDLPKSERYMSLIADVFSIINYRSERVGELYPFVIKDGCLEIKADFNIYGSIYVFLLCASCTHQVSHISEMTDKFEILCGQLIKRISFMGADFIPIGTSGNVKTRSVFDKIQLLSEELNSNLTNSFQDSARYKSPSGGDGGVDLVAVRKFNDGFSYLPLMFCQCTCSRDKWIEKQNEITYDTWTRRLSNLPRYVEIMWLPFSVCRADGMPENPSNIKTCLMDRFRIIDVYKEKQEEVLTDDINELIRRELMAE